MNIINGDWVQYTPDVIKNYANFSIDHKEKIMKVYSVKFGELDIDDHFIFDKMFIRKTCRVNENITEDMVNEGLVKPNCLNICNGKRYILKYDTECFLLNNPLEEKGLI